MGEGGGARDGGEAGLTRPHPVIPAKAGNQADMGRLSTSWFPAFAGMSGTVAPV
jgi:hypothetical protein